MREINLHHHDLFAAKTAILEHVANSFNMDELGIIFIHGHNRGTAIRDYLRSNLFLSDLKQDGMNVVGRMDTSKPGQTELHFS
jgi:hypothetical protein